MLEKIELIFSKETSSAWDTNVLSNSLSLICAEKYLEEMIKKQGFISLYDVKKHLGMVVSLEDLQYYIDNVESWTFGSMLLDDGTNRITFLMKHF